MIFVSKHIIPKGYAGLALFPFVFVKHEYLKRDAAFVNHERIHLRQQLELLVFPFFICYVLEFSLRLIQYRNWREAYRNISFEREAYANEENLKYLKGRRFWSFIKYL